MVIYKQRFHKGLLWTSGWWREELKFPGTKYTNNIILLTLGRCWRSGMGSLAAMHPANFAYTCSYLTSTIPWPGAPAYHISAKLRNAWLSYWWSNRLPDSFFRSPYFSPSSHGL